MQRSRRLGKERLVGGVSDQRVAEGEAPFFAEALALEDAFAGQGLQFWPEL